MPVQLTRPTGQPSHKMKTLADFKRRLIPGLAVTVKFPSHTINGNTSTTVLPAATQTRKVWSVTPSCVIWESTAPGLRAPGSRLYWPKADCIRFPDANSAEVSHEPNGPAFATYRFN